MTATIDLRGPITRRKVLPTVEPNQQGELYCPNETCGAYCGTIDASEIGCRTACSECGLEFLIGDGHEQS